VRKKVLLLEDRHQRVDTGTSYGSFAEWGRSLWGSNNLWLEMGKKMDESLIISLFSLDYRNVEAYSMNATRRNWWFPHWNP
jgi:hypothetical protein